MTKNIFRRILSIASALAIVFTAYPPVIFADDGGLCPHHPEHTAECGYVEGVSPCGYVCEICDPPEISDSNEPSDASEVTTSPEEQPPVTTAPEPEPVETLTTEATPEESETMPTEPLPEPESSPAEPEIQLMSVNGEHNCNGISDWQAWESDNTLPTSPGNWYLTQPVTLTSGWTVPQGEVKLCLNGQTVNCGGSSVTVGTGASLTVYDCQNGEGITGSGVNTVYVNGGTFTLKSGKIFNDNSNWEAVRVDNSGTASIQGGTVEATGQAINSVSDSSVIKVTGGEIKGGSGSLVYAIQSSGMLEISGGNITSAEDNAVRISYDCNFNLSGSPVIDGIIRLDGGSVITIDKPLSGQYVVDCSKNRVFAQGSRAAEAKGCFVLSQNLQDEGYGIVAVENELKATIPHEHDGINFETWVDDESLPSKAGNYVLVHSVRLSDTWKVPEGETTLCLNGSSIRSMGGSIDIPKNATLIICNCSIHSSGRIEFENAACINVSGKLILKGGRIENSLSGKAINVGSSGLLMIEDGKVNGEACAISGESGSNINILNGEISGSQGPAISTAGNLTVSGGRLTGNIYYGIDVTGELTLAGNPEINISTPGTPTSADIHVTNPINIPEPIFGESYSVYMDKVPGVLAKGDGAAESFECFTSASSDYRVEKVGSELWLVPKDAHVHEDDGTIFEAWDSSNSLPTDSGNYYLKNDVKIEIFGNNWVVNGDTKLCLNGHKITFASMKWTEVPADTSLTVFDCNGVGSIVGGALHCINNVEGTFTLEGGTIEVPEYTEAISAGSGKIIINGGIVKGEVSGSTVTITDGQINGKVTASNNLNISGGTIINSPTAVTADSGTFTLSGEPTIEGNIVLWTPITVNEKLEGGPYSIQVYYSSPYTFATGAGAAASIGCFELTKDLIDQGYEIAAVDDTLVARLKTYTIKYEPGEGSGSIDSQTKTHGKDIEISSEKFTRPGYTQIGWKTADGVEYAFGADYADNANLTLYPVWKQNEIHFYKDGEKIESLSLKVGESAQISVTITPDGAVCDPIKWTAQSGISIDPDTGSTVTVTGDSAGEFELTASTDGGITTKTLTVTVSRFDSAVSAEDQTVTYGDDVTITAKVEKSASNGIALIADYDNKVTFMLGGKSLGEAEVKNGEATLTIPATRANGFAIGENTVILQYSGSGELERTASTVKVNVTPKPLTATITGTTTKTYDGNTSADDLGLELKLSDVVDGDTVSASAEFAFDSANAGERTISAENATLTGEHADYYVLDEINPIMGKINPKPVEITWNGGNFTYDGEPHTVTATVENAVGNDKFEIKYADNSATNVGNYTAKVTSLGNENYTLNGAIGVEHAWKITALSLADAQIEIVGSYTYNGEVQTPEIIVTLGGKELLSGKDYTLEYSGEVKNADKYTVTLTGTGNYSGNAITEFKIAPKSLTASISGTLSKVYDGTTDVNDDVKIALTGVIGTDDVTATAEISYDSANAGARKIAAKNISLSGEDSKNYALARTQAETSRSITPAPITLPNTEFIYGGEAKTVIQVSGIGETVTATLTAFSSDAGEYEYSEAAKENSYTVELSSDNYSVNKAGVLTIKPLVALLEWQGDEFTYDGTVHEVTATVKNAVAGDKFNIAYTNNTATNVGNYTAKVTALGNANYALDNPDALQWSILPAVAEFTWVGNTFAYDGQEHSVSAEVKKVAENDEFVLTYKNEKSSKIGSYTAEVMSLGNSNYTLDGSTSKTHAWSISKSTLTVATLPTAAEITYGQSLSDSALIGGVVMNGKIAVSGSFAWVDGDETPAVKDSGKSFAVVFTPDDNSYDPVEAEVTITVNKAVLTPKIGRIDNKVYDGGTAANGAITLSGAKFDDMPTVIAKFNFVDKNAGKNKSVNVSDITLAGSWSDNYELSTVSLLNQSTSAEILPRAAEIEWTGEDFAYDGEAHTVTATVKNAVAGDKFEIAYTGNTATKAGDYTAKVSALGNANYTLNGATSVEHAWKITAASQAAPEVKIDFINETLSTDKAMEFSVDGETWQDCTAAMNVTKTGWNGSALTVKIRYKKDVDHLDGEIQSLVIPARRAAPDISEMAVSKSQTEISIAEISGCEYSLDGVTWQDSGVFGGLDKGETYKIHVRYKATVNAFASFVTSKTVVTSSTADGTTELLPGETVAAGDGSIKNLGGEIIIDDGTGNVTTVTLPEGGSVEVDEQGCVSVPDGGKVAVGDNPAISLPEGGTVEPDGTVIADEVKVGDTDVKGEDVTVTPDGNITVLGEGQVTVGDNPEIILPTGGTVEPDGTVIADEVKVGNTDVQGKDVTVEPDGNITVPGEGSVKIGDNSEITLPTGGTVEPDGTVIADEVKVGNTDVKGDDVTVTPDGNITVPGDGSVKVGNNPEIILPTGGTVEPNGTVIADEVKVGNTDVKGKDVTVEPDGNITLPEGGKVSVEGEPEKIVPSGATIVDGEINAPAIAEPTDGIGSLGDDIILKIEPADERLETADRENLKDAANAIVREVYDIELLKNGVEVEPDKSIKLTVSADVSGAKMKVFTLDNDGKFNEIDAEFDAENGKFTIVTDSLGIFILTSEEGQISAEVVASGGAPEVEIGDDDRKALEEDVFTDDDEAAIENGDNVKIVMNVDGISEEDIPADDIAEIEAFLDDLAGCEVAEYADITLKKITEDGVTGDEIKSEAISEINNPIKLVIDIPETLHKAGRIFSVIRLHDGKAELLNDTDQSDETVTILTDKFSLYVLIYRDPASQPSHVHSFTAWINVGEAGHLARCSVCGEVMALMPHTMLNGVCTACGYVLHSYLPDDGDVIEIEVPTEGMIANEEVVDF